MKNFRKEKIDDRVTIFDPRGVKDYLSSYPELKTINEFKKLTIPQLKFVWWVANPTSELVDKDSNNYRKDMQKRIEIALDITLPTMILLEKQKWIMGRFPDRIRVAINRMESINVEMRTEAKMMIEKMWKNCKEIVDGGIDFFKDKDGNFEPQKMATTQKIIKNELVSLIKFKEEGFGVSKSGKEGKAELEGQNNVSSYLRGKKGN